MRCTKATTNDWDIRTSVAVKALSVNISWMAKHICIIELALESAHQSVSNNIWCCSNHSSLKDKWSHNQQSSPVGYQVTNGGITRELDKEPLLHCSSIYIIYMWSMLQQYYSCPNVHASSSCPITHPHIFSIRPPCFLHVPWCHTFNLYCTYAHHVYTMRNPCPLTIIS